MILFFMNSEIYCNTRLSMFGLITWNDSVEELYIRLVKLSLIVYEPVTQILTLSINWGVILTVVFSFTGVCSIE